MTWGQTEKWPYIPKRASFLESPVLISLSVVGNIHFVTSLLCLLLNLIQSSLFKMLKILYFLFPHRTATVWRLQWLHHKCLGCSQGNTSVYSVWTWEPRQYTARLPWRDGLLHRFLGPHSEGMKYWLLECDGTALQSAVAFLVISCNFCCFFSPDLGLRMKTHRFKWRADLLKTHRCFCLLEYNHRDRD